MKLNFTSALFACRSPPREGACASVFAAEFFSEIHPRSLEASGRVRTLPGKDLRCDDTSIATDIFRTSFGSVSSEPLDYWCLTIRISFFRVPNGGRAALRASVLRRRSSAHPCPPSECSDVRKGNRSFARAALECLESSENECQKVNVCKVYII